MATMTLPIQELELSVRVGTYKAYAEAECVGFYSSARAIKPFSMTVKFGMTAVLLKFLLWSLSRHQRALIRAYQGINFNVLPQAELGKWAEKLEKILERGRPTLAKVELFGPRTQALWGSVLVDISQELDHMESIAQSLRSGADVEVSLLLAAAADYMAASPAIS